MEKQGDDPEVNIPELLKEWDKLQDEIKTYFMQRDNRNTAAPMEQGINYLIELILLTNGIPVNQINNYDISSLPLTPVNIGERLQFLKARPNIYPSFIQLTELMEEQQKHYAKVQAIRKINPGK